MENTKVFFDTDVLLNWLCKEEDSNTGYKLWKAPYKILKIVCVSVVMGCSDSPTEDETRDEHDNKQPSLENMVYIPAGEFVMGSEEVERAFDEKPQHKESRISLCIESMNISGVFEEICVYWNATSEAYLQKQYDFHLLCKIIIDL